MLKRRIDASRTVQMLLRVVEAATDRAAAGTATYIAEMLQVRPDANVALTAAAEMLDKLVGALTAHVEAQAAPRSAQAHARGAQADRLRADARR